MKKLTALASRFCTEYIVDLNGAQAAIRAGAGKGDASVAARYAYKWLRDPLAQARITHLRQAQDQRIEIRADDVLAELRKIAFDGANETRDRIKALELLGKHKRLFVDRLEHAGADGSPLQVSININRTVALSAAGDT